MNSREKYWAKASATYHEQMTSRSNVDHLAVKSGREYWTSHGIAPERHFEIVTKYRIGVVIDPLNGDEAFKGMLSIPYITRNGVKAVKYRNLTDSKPKNLVPEGQKVRLYNTNAYFDADEVVGIAEGEADSLVATEVLGIPTLGVPGSEDWKAYRRVWSPLFKNFQKVLVFTDGDPINPNTGLRPGEELGKAIRESLSWRARIVKCPEGEDVSSMVAAGKADELIKQFGDDEDGDD